MPFTDFLLSWWARFVRRRRTACCDGAARVGADRTRESRELADSVGEPAVRRHTMRTPLLIGGLLLSAGATCNGQSGPRSGVSASASGEYEGAYRWTDGSFIYLQRWSELTGSPQLVAFNENGELRVLYSRDRDRFVAGPGAAV